MKKSIIFFIAILLLCIGGWGVYLFNKPHENVGNYKAEVIISADSLYNLYSKNEEEANAKFLNKIITVKGKVDNITETNTTHIVLLKSRDNMGGVSCNLFSPINKNINLNTGDTAIIKGRCTGFLMDVALTDCVFETND